MNDKPHSIEAWLAALGNPSADRDYKPGHERVRALLSRLELRRPALRVRVAGTNGKGSTSFMLAAALQARGLRVGLYTSPHILHFNERIRIDGEPVAESALLADLERIMPIALEVGASYFETATALALAQFTAARVDVEILEAGVGARLDATTAVEADVALVTPIGLDHQAWLGETLAEVAAEKAYVMQGCRIAISAAQPPEVETILRQFNPELRFCPPAAMSLAAAGTHQQVNAGLALAAASTLADELALDMHATHSTISKAVVPGRLQRIDIDRATVWLDAAHNRHAVEALLPGLPQFADPFDAIIVFTREDRSLDDCLPLLAPHARMLISRNNAAEPAEALAEAIAERPDGHFLVLGSFLTVAAILNRYGKRIS